MSSEDLQPEKNQGLDEFQEDDNPVLFACRKCGEKHPIDEGRTCEDGGEN